MSPQPKRAAKTWMDLYKRFHQDLQTEYLEVKAASDNILREKAKFDEMAKMLGKRINILRKPPFNMQGRCLRDFLNVRNPDLELATIYAKLGKLTVKMAKFNQTVQQNLPKYRATMKAYDALIAELKKDIKLVDGDSKSWEVVLELFMKGRDLRWVTFINGHPPSIDLTKLKNIIEAQIGIKQLDADNLFPDLS